LTAWKLKVIEFRRDILLSTRRFAEKKMKIWIISQKRDRIGEALNMLGDNKGSIKGN
jgi:hypothetical protein